MPRRRVLTLFVLAFWLLLGPVSMAFDGCLLMGALCDGGPCGASSNTACAPTPAVGLELLAYLDAAPRSELPANAPTAHEPPPKSPRSLA